MEHEHHFYYPPPNGPISTGVCACGVTSTGPNVSDMDLRLPTKIGQKGYAWREWVIYNRERIRQVREEIG